MTRDSINRLARGAGNNYSGVPGTRDSEGNSNTEGGVWPLKLFRYGLLK